MTRHVDIPEAVLMRAGALIDAHPQVTDTRTLVALAFMERRSVLDEQFGLSPMQADVLGFLRGFQSPTGQGPTFEEIKEGCGLSSKSLVACAIDGLEQRGFVRRLKGRHRSIALVDLDHVSGAHKNPVEA